MSPIEGGGSRKDESVGGGARAGGAPTSIGSTRSSHHHRWRYVQHWKADQSQETLSRATLPPRLRFLLLRVYLSFSLVFVFWIFE